MARIPAICGGVPAFPEGPPSWPPADDDVREALQRAYADGSWGRYHGPHVAALEDRLRRWCAVDHAQACSSGTVAVELALRGLGVGPGDEVILGGYDFPGNFRAIEAVGAWPVVVDLEDRTGCLAIEQVSAGVSPATKAVIATHLHGGLVDMPRLVEAMRARGIGVVEDACQAAGALVAGRPAGAWGDVGVWSFGGSKLLTAGRGGAVVTPRDDVRQRMKIASERGNLAWPLSELQAAVLLPQFDKLSQRHRQRRDAARRLIDGLSASPRWSPPALPASVVGDDVPRWEPAYYKLGLRLDRTRLGDDARETLVAAARAEGLALDAGFRGFTSRGKTRCRKVGDLPCSLRAAAETIVLHHPILLAENDAVDRAAAVLADLLERLAAGELDGRRTAELPLRSGDADV